MLMSVLHHKALQKHKERHTHTSHTRPSTQTLTHTEAESLNRDIQDRAIITRQMNTWRQSTLRRGRGNDRSLEQRGRPGRPGSGVSHGATQHHRPDLGELSGNTQKTRHVSLSYAHMPSCLLPLSFTNVYTQRIVSEHDAFKGRRVLGGGKP